MSDHSRSDDSASAPFFSVVIPTYRRNEMLAEAVDSVLEQTFDDYELIVVDDDPEAGAREVAQGAGNGVIYLQNHQRRGGAGTRNTGIFKARGSWVAFLDDDDIWLPKKLERQHRSIVAHGEGLGLVCTARADYDPAGTSERSVRWCRLEPEGGSNFLMDNWIGGLSTVAARTDLLRQIGGFDERFLAMQDLDLYHRLSELGDFSCVDEPLVLIRRNNDDSITMNADRKLEASKLFFEKYREEIVRDARLRHRAAARVFTFALASRDLGAVAASTPWTLAGVLLDRQNLRRVLSRVVQQVRFERRGRGG